MAASHKDFQKLDHLFDKGDSIPWEIADLIIQLVDEKGELLKDIADRYKRKDGTTPPGRSYARLSQYYSNGKEFPKGVRRLELLFDQHEAVRIAAKRVDKIAGEAGSDFKIDRTKYLNQIGESIETGRRLSRALARAMADEAGVALQEQRKKQNGKHIADLPPAKAWWVDQMFKGDYVDTLARMEDESCDLVEMDAPFAQFTKTPNGKYDRSASAATVTDCANATEEEAIATTVAGIPIAARKIKKDGVIALWQSGHGLRWQISKAITDAGLVMEPMIVWNKSGGKPQPGNNSSPTSLSIECCYILRRKDGKPVNLAQNHKEYFSRKQVWDFPGVHHDAAQVDLSKGTHMFEKHRCCNELLLHKFTSENGTVFICFGGSGSMAEACIIANRRYVYCELEKRCYELAEARIARCRELAAIPVAQKSKHDEHPKMLAAKKLAIELMLKHNVPKDWQFRWLSATKCRGGHCNHTDHIIGMHRILGQYGNDEITTEVVIHEIAHCLVGPGHGHDEIWRSKCIELGGTGNTFLSKEGSAIMDKYRGK